MARELAEKNAAEARRKAGGGGRKRGGGKRGGGKSRRKKKGKSLRPPKRVSSQTPPAPPRRERGAEQTKEKRDEIYRTDRSTPPARGSELVADVLWDHTNYGVTVCDVNDVIALQRDKRTFWDYIDEELTAQPSDVLVKCYLPVDIADAEIASIRAELDALRERGAGYIDFGTFETGRREIEGDDWIDVWKKHFRPPAHRQPRRRLPRVDRLRPAARRGGRLSRFEHGLRHRRARNDVHVPRISAKNTCTPATPSSTSAAAAASSASPPSSWAPRFAYLTDIDYVAVRSAEHNAALNGVEGSVKVALSDLLEGADIRGEVMTANITADILCRLAGSIPQKF